MEKKRKPWIRPRHRIIESVLITLFSPYCRWRYNYKPQPFGKPGDGPYLILLNHQTPFDQFFVALTFPKPLYFLATEDIFSKGWLSSLIRWLVAPIPIKKQTTDVAAVMTCLRVAKEGGTICIAPEGNRTYSGRTEYMNPAIAALAKKLGLPIVLFRIEGGYGSEPRWSDVVRKGSLKAYAARVIAPEEYRDMPTDRLMEEIRTGLYVDEACADGEFRSNKRAEYLERAIYVCPFCGLARFESHGNQAECKECGRKITYGTDKRISGVGFEFPFEFMAQWYDYQCRFVRELDLSAYYDRPLFRDQARFSEVIVYKKKVLLRKEAGIGLYGNRFVVDEGTDRELVFPFEEVTAVSVLGRNKLNIYHNKRVYQLKGSKRFNALKYVNIYFCHKNIHRGDTDGKFLGL